jgi:hypothetical protein
LKLVGCVLLISGWFIVLAALVLLAAFLQRIAFVTAGLAVELLGLALLTISYRSLQRSQR